MSQQGAYRVEVAEEIAARVAFTAFHEGMRAGLAEVSIDALRHFLVGRGPIAVAAAEGGEPTPACEPLGAPVSAPRRDDERPPGGSGQ